MTVSGQILKEGNLFLYSILLGVILTFVYDLLRIIRRLFSHEKWGIAVEDLLFWIASALSVFLMLYRKNDGSLRSFALIGLVLGMLFYKKFLSFHVVKISVFLLKRLLRILFWPLIKIKQFLRPLVRRFGYFFKKVLKKPRRNVKMIRYRLKVQRNRKHGNKKRVSKD